MSHTLTVTEDGKPLTETQDGITMPADYSFGAVNDFVHGFGTNFEDLQYLCLGMSTHIEKLMRGEFICQRCGIRKDGNQTAEHEF